MFPIVYIISDVVSEVYGYNVAKKAIWGGLIANVYALSALTIVAYIAGSESAMYGYIIGDYGVASAVVVAIAGFSAYLVASFVNAYVMKKMKDRDKEKRFALRAIVSTLFGESCDSAVFGVIACVCGLWSWNDFVPTVTPIIVLKTSVEALCLPVTTRVVRKIEAIESR